MKRVIAGLAVLILCICFVGCHTDSGSAQVVATTLPVYEFAEALCRGTNIQVAQLVTESVSCLHDYTLQVRQMQLIENAEVVILSGAGLDFFVKDALASSTLSIDASENITLLCTEAHHDHSHEHTHADTDPHIWLSPANAKIMADNIFNGLCNIYPQYQTVFSENLQNLNLRFDALQDYGERQLADIRQRDCITFHDGFAYLADAFDFNILRAIEEESGSEASAREIIELITLIDTHNISAIFTERNGVASSADILNAETGVPVYVLDMAMSGDSYFDAMYHNINTLKEALK